MLKGVKIRIYPNKEQQNLISRTFGCTRLIYNKGLAMRKDSYEQNKISIGYKETNAMLSALKKNDDYAFLKEVDSISLQQALRDLDKAYKNFFKNKFGFPKFKSKHNNYATYRTQNVNNSICITLDKKYIKLPKLGYVRAKVSMDITSAKINNATIEKTSSGKYFCVLNIDIPTPDVKNNGCLVGLDLGIKSFYTDSNNFVCENQKFLAKSSKKLVKEQRKLSRMIESHIIGYTKGKKGVEYLLLINLFRNVKIYKNRELKLQDCKNILLTNVLIFYKKNLQNL